MNAQIPLPQKLLFIHRPVPLLLKNIAKRGRDYEQSISSEYLSSIQRTYWDYFREEKRYPIAMVDVGEADFMKDENVLQQLIDIVNAPANPGLKVFELTNEILYL